MRSWIDRPYDALMIASFAGWEEPAHLIALARAIAGSRPLMVLTRGFGWPMLVTGRGHGYGLRSHQSKARRVARA